MLEIEKNLPCQSQSHRYLSAPRHLSFFGLFALRRYDYSKLLLIYGSSMSICQKSPLSSDSVSSASMNVGSAFKEVTKENIVKVRVEDKSFDQ